MSQDVHLYGIKNCDTVRKSIKWLALHQIASNFHDLKNEFLEPELITEWIQQVGQDKLINKRGLTWRKLAPEEKLIADQQAAITLIQNHPTVVKRPVVFNGTFWSVGFKEEDWDKLFL
jgi:Spx/MgsR family transcriptional regulator